MKTASLSVRDNSLIGNKRALEIVYNLPQIDMKTANTKVPKLSNMQSC